MDNTNIPHNVTASNLQEHVGPVQEQPPPLVSGFFQRYQVALEVQYATFVSEKLICG